MQGEDQEGNLYKLGSSEFTNIAEKENFNLNYGISAQINIPLGKSPALCHEATMVNIEAQRLLIKKTLS